MKRKIIGATAAYMSGLFFASFFTDARCWILFALAVFTVLVFGRNNKWKAVDHLFLAVVFALGFGVNTLYTSVCFEPAVSLDGKNGCFEGRVTEITRYDGEMESCILKGRANGETSVKVNYYGDALNAEYGDIVRFEECTFSRPENSYLFSSEMYYKSDGVFLTVDDVRGVSIDSTNSCRIKNAVSDFRERMTLRLMTETEPDAGAFLAGMVFGEKRLLDEDIKTSLYRSGIGHILAVSGLHISVIVSLLMTLLHSIGANRKLSFFLMNIVLLGFIFLANCPVSAVRAAIMMNFFYASSLFRRQNDPLTSLAGAAMVICIVNPYSIYNEGFILSLSGTFGIAVFAPFMTKNMKSETLWESLVKSLADGLCTAVSVFPVSILFFDETSVISPVTNMLMLPLCSAAMIFGLIFVISGGIFPILAPAEILVKTVILVSEKLAGVSIFHISHGSETIASMLIFLGFACVGAYMILQKRRFTALAVAAALIVYGGVAVYDSANRRNSLTVAVLGNRYNSVIVLRCGDCTDVIDLTGYHRSAEYVSHYLAVNGIDTINSLILLKSPQSQYSAFVRELKYVKTESCLALSDDEIIETNISDYFDEKGFVLEENGCLTDYADGIVKITYGGDSIIFSPSDNYSQTDGILVCYGKNDGKKANDVIYTDENNFELVLSEKGRYRRGL